MSDTPEAPTVQPQQATLVLQPKFQRLDEVLHTELIERSAVISTSVLALISGTHHFQLGVPGVAKSMTVRRMTEHIGGLTDTDYFEHLMTRFSAPEEVFGPYDLTALQDSRFRRNTNLMMPEAKIAFLDEVFKANASILNALLWILNERIFRNDGEVKTVPLWSMFCASNELPEGEELNALFDRIHFRLVVRPIQELGNFIQMMKLNMVPRVGEIVTWNEVEQAHAEAMKVEVPEDVLEALAQVRQDLKNDGIEPTDRRFAETRKVIQAQAWLEGETVAAIEHCRPLSHMLWTTPEEAPRVERVILDLANPLDREALTLLELVDGLAAELDKVLSDKTIDQTLVNKKGVELHNKIDRAKEDLTKLTTQVNKSGRKAPKVDEVRDRLRSVTKRLLKEIFKIEDAQF